VLLLSFLESVPRTDGLANLNLF